jgi:Ca2+-transporting ATPase
MKAHETVRWHGLQIAEAVELLDSDLDKGLLENEAKIRLAKYGPNRVTRRPGTPASKRFLLQFHQPLIYMLLLAGAITAGLGEIVDSSVIFGVVMVIAIVGYLQASKAEKAIDSLSRLTRSDATVRRDGKRRRITSEELVPGDVVLLETEDRVPADLRLTAMRALRVDESALTGESLPAHKHPDPIARDSMLADRFNLAFAGTLVTSGKGEGVVWATGDKTETGRIAWLISEAVNLSTPLTRKVAEFSRLLLWLILGLSGIVVVVGLWHGKELVEISMAAVALAVGAIPEGLAAVATITLAIGVARMAARRAIIRNLPAVETLGSTTTICSDKTGTLTKNQMTVQEIYTDGRLFQLTGTGYDPAGELRLDSRPMAPRDHPALIECLKAGLLCNDSRLVHREGRWEMEGDPTEAALIVAARKAGLLHNEMDLAHPRIDAIPFESEHQFMAIAVAFGVSMIVAFEKRLRARAEADRGSDDTLEPAVHRI